MSWTLNHDNSVPRVPDKIVRSLYAITPLVAA